MKVLITGANGLVGAALTEHCLRLGWQVTALDRTEPPEELLRAWSAGPGQVTSVLADVREFEALTQVLEPCLDTVVHAATVTSDAVRDAATPDFVMEVNILGTINVLKAAKRAGVKRFIYVSSNAVYGRNSIGQPHLDEAETICDPYSLYSVSKFAAEKTVKRLGELWRCDVRIARLSSVFGPWERDTGVRDTLNPMLQTTLAALRSEEVILARPCRRDWIYSRDVAAALVALLVSERLRYDVYNIGPGADHSWTVEDWCARLSGAFPNFSYRVALPNELSNIDLHEAVDRAPLSAKRLFSDTDFQPSFGINEAFADVLSWRESYPSIWS